MIRIVASLELVFPVLGIFHVCLVNGEVVSQSIPQVSQRNDTPRLRT